MEDMKFCQSCGMPMGETDEMYGTEKDGTKSEDYCKYCYTDGQFYKDQTLEEMVETCVPFMMEDNKELTKKEATNQLMAFLPTLKRWNTANV